MMLDDYPDTFTLVQIHLGDAYQTVWGGNRDSFYTVGGTPDAWFDGILEVSGSGSTATAYAAYQARYNARMATSTDVVITITGSQTGAQTFEMTAQVCLEAYGTGKTMRIHMVEVLDNWPSYPSYSRNTFRQAAAAEDLTLAPGECADVVRTFTFSSTSWANQENIKIIAWAQNPLSSAPAEVYQADRVGWPFPARLGLEWTMVGDGGNAADTELMNDGTTGYGAVDHSYQIALHEVTIGDYTEFLRAVASVGDVNGLYDPDMEGTYGGIVRTGWGSPHNPYLYSLKDDDPAWATRPVNFVSWYDALRLANWFHNNQPLGMQGPATTEDGAYDMSLGDAVTRKPGARVFLPTEDEWYKAAYYHGGGSASGYWDYATQSDVVPTAEAPAGGSNSANYDNVIGAPNYSTEVGAYPSSPSAYWTFDQNGNTREWTETDVFGDGSSRAVRGGSWSDDASHLPAGYRDWAAPGDGSADIGFRMASFVDCNDNDVADECDADCGLPGGMCDIPGCGLGSECNLNGILDECDLAAGTSDDCQPNGVPDECDLDPTDPDGNGEISTDCDADGTPDDCQADCDLDGTPDICELPPLGTSGDCNVNTIPDECDIVDATSEDCQLNGVPDECDLDPADPDGNGQTSDDCDADDVPDECQADCDEDGTPDVCELAPIGESGDCNENGVPDECDVADGTSVDSQPNGVPDECEVYPVATASYPYNRSRSRYVSFDPNKAGNDGKNVAFRIELQSLTLRSCDGSGSPDVEGWSCRTDDDCRACSATGTPCISAAVDCEPDPPGQTCVPTGALCLNDQAGSVGRTWWVGPEHPTLGNDVHLMVTEPYRLVSDDWPPVVHVTDCEIVPIATYGIQTVNADTDAEADEFVVRTTDKPEYWWGDCVGELGDYCTGNWAPCTGDGDCPVGETCVGQWPPPDGITNFQDVTAAVFTFSGMPSVTVTDYANLDLHGNDGGDAREDPPNGVVNFADIANIIGAFQGRPYPYFAPANCPDRDSWP